MNRLLTSIFLLAAFSASAQLVNGNLRNGEFRSNTNAVAGGGGGGFTADMWQTFEFSAAAGAVTAVLLDGTDNITGGTWVVTDTGSKLSTSASGEQAMVSQVNSTTDTGTLGLARSLSGGTAASVQYQFAAAKTTFSIGFWLKTVALGSFSTGYEVLNIKDNTGAVGNADGVGQLRNQGDGHQQIEYHGGGDFVITEGTIYWITVQWVKNATSTIKIYSTAGSLLHTGTWTGFNGDAVCFNLFGDTANHAVTAYVDDVVVNFTGTFPLGP